MSIKGSVQRKVRRLSEGGPLRALDLFAGCGGFSLGFLRAGFSITGAIEIDPQAMATHALNFLPNNKSQGVRRDAGALDIVDVDPSQFLKAIGVREALGQAIDVLIGGPPCQAFARIGRAKLREVANNPNAHTFDKRAGLVNEYIRFVESLRPLALVIENVPDMMNHGGVNMVANVCESLSRLGYVCRYTLLNSAAYGVPQYRERVFIVGFHESLGVVPKFPRPSHSFDLPPGYHGSRCVAMKPILDSGRDCEWYVELTEDSASSQKAISCYEALSDLPMIVNHLKGDIAKGPRRLDELVPYSSQEALSSYASLMRNWPGFSTKSAVNSHVTRSLPRDYETFKRMKPGAQYPEAYEVAVQIFRETLARMNGNALSPKSSEANKIWNRIVPPYDAAKFPNKWWKLDPHRPSRTLTAHIGKDTYSHIHYDSRQARTISVREAARLQSFPDGFRFAGAMNAAFRQIGNAVPPLLAFAVAKQVRTQLKGSARLCRSIS